MASGNILYILLGFSRTCGAVFCLSILLHPSKSQVRLPVVFSCFGCLGWYITTGRGMAHTTRSASCCQSPGLLLRRQLYHGHLELRLPGLGGNNTFLSIFPLYCCQSHLLLSIHAALQRLAQLFLLLLHTCAFLFILHSWQF